jgi:hypothetical protein
MTKKILTIGLDLASDAAHEEEFRSKASLLDWDIVLFKPVIFELTLQRGDDYQGKPCLTDTASFALKEACEHWRREIKQAIETGKTILVFLSAIEEVFVATGEHQYSGTGRNTRTTRIVTLQNNYSTLPISLKAVSGTGTAIKLAHNGAEVIAPYWAEFGSISQYKILLPQDVKGTCLITKHGDRPVGAILRSQNSSGSLVLLPDIDFYPDDFLQETDDEFGWTDKAKQFAARMVSAVVALDKALHASSDITPEPAWAADPTFMLAKELDLQSELLESERLVEEAQKRKEEVQERLKTAGQFRSLLYEKGKPLEQSIIEALRLLNFQATPYKDSESEFDVVFESQEGRLLGEAEGKDAKAVNVDKLRQLAMNIHEDLQRDEVKTPAKGVLFGNGYRLSPPGDRDTQFTAKCITAAQSSSTALIATTDLYTVVQYLAEHSDEGYAKLCREAILAGVGIVKLPSPPSVPTPREISSPLVPDQAQPR